MITLRKLFNLPAAVFVGLTAGALVLASKAVPKCMHDEEHYSFPRAPQKDKRQASEVFGQCPVVLRTCNICGEVKFYDWTNMRFLTNRERKQFLEKLGARTPDSVTAVV